MRFTADIVFKPHVVAQGIDEAGLLPGAIVEVQGPILHASELESFMNQVQLLDRTLTGDALLECMEPNLHIAIRASGGHTSLTIRLTPDHLTQAHEFTFRIDQTYFKPVIANCKKILSDYPIRGSPDS